MGKQRWLVQFMALAMVAVGSLSGCGSKPAANQQAQPASQTAPAAGAPAPASKPAEKPVTPIKVRIGAPTASVIRYSLEYMVSTGLDKKHGLELETKWMDFTTLGNAIQQGAIDVNAALAPNSVVTINSKQKTDLAIFAPMVWSGNAFVASAKSGAKSLSDLKGKKLGNFSKTTGAYFLSAVLAKLKGYDIDKDFQPVYAETPALVGLMQRSDLDVALLYEPFTLKLMNSGSYNIVADLDEEFKQVVGVRALKAGLGASRKWAEQNPEAVKRLREMVREGLEKIQKGEDKAFFESKGAELYGISDKELMNAAYAKLAPSYANQWDQVLWDGTTKILTEGQKLGLIPADGNLDIFLK